MVKSIRITLDLRMDIDIVEQAPSPRHDVHARGSELLSLWRSKWGCSNADAALPEDRRHKLAIVLVVGYRRPSRCTTRQCVGLSGILTATSRVAYRSRSRSAAWCKTSKTRHLPTVFVQIYGSIGFARRQVMATLARGWASLVRADTSLTSGRLAASPYFSLRLAGEDVFFVAHVEDAPEWKWETNPRLPLCPSCRKPS